MSEEKGGEIHEYQGYTWSYDDPGAELVTLPKDAHVMPMHKYCLKCKKWKDADGLSGTCCKTCGTGLVPRYLVETREERQRDTQFAGFAKLLMREINEVPLDPVEDGYILRTTERLIAQRAYDLACHVLSEVSGFSNPEHVLLGLNIDLTEWPK